MSKLSNFLLEDNFNQNYESLYESSITTSKKNTGRIESLLSFIKNDKTEDKIIKDILNLISQVILENLSADEFDEVALKFMNKLNDLFKDLMNRLKVCSNQKDSLLSVLVNLESLNFSYAKFFKKFNENFQTYNEKHKNLMKIIPNGLKIFFKLFEENYELIYTSRPETLKSFLINIINLINYFPLMIRPYESRLESIFKNILTNTCLSSNSDKEILNAVCVCYTLFIRLSPDINTKINLFLKKILANFEFYTNIFIPKTVKTLRSNVNESEVKNFDSNFNFFNFKESKQKFLKNPNFQMAFKVLNILAKLLKNVFKSIPRNTSTEINFSDLMNFLINNIKSYITFPFNLDKDELVLEGLKISDYKIFKEINQLQSLKMFKFLIKNFSGYFYYFIPAIKSTFSILIIKFDEYTKLYDNYKETLKVMKLIIEQFDSNLNSVVEDLIFKLCVNNLIDLLVSFTERKDKTVVKIDQNYFKLKTLKNQTQKNKPSLSLIQMAKKEAFNENLEKYSNSEMEEILNLYLDIFVAYFQSDSFLFLLTNEDKRVLIRSLVDLVILPPYAKFIFSIPISVKKNLIRFVYNYLKYSNYMMNVEQLERFIIFLKAFHSNDEIEKNHIIQIYDIINKQIKVNSRHISVNDVGDFTRVTVDLNKKIADKLRNNADLILNKIELDIKQDTRDSLLNKKRKANEVDQTKEEKIDKEINLIKTINNKKSSGVKDSFKIELSLQEEEDDIDIEENFINRNSNLVNKKKQFTRSDMKINETKNELSSSKDEEKGSLKSKWNVVDKNKNKNEFISTEKIVMILKDKKSFLEREDKNPSYHKHIEEKIPQIQEKLEEIKEEKIQIDSQSDSESDLDSEIEIPDIF